MKKFALSLALTIHLQCGTTPPEVTPQSGCEFAALVLKEVDRENTRIVAEFERAILARRVVLVVQQKSGSNLRENTLSWMRQNCPLSSPSSPSPSSSSSPSRSASSSSVEVGPPVGSK